MTCTYPGNPQPTVTCYEGNVDIMANSKFWYNSTRKACSGCSLTVVLGARAWGGASSGAGEQNHSLLGHTSTLRFTGTVLYLI